MRRTSDGQRANTFTILNTKKGLQPRSISTTGPAEAGACRGMNDHDIHRRGSEEEEVTMNQEEASGVFISLVVIAIILMVFPFILKFGFIYCDWVFDL